MSCSLNPCIHAHPAFDCSGDSVSPLLQYKTRLTSRKWFWFLRGLKIVKTVYQVENLNHILNLGCCAHMKKPIYSNEVKLIETLYKWYDKNTKKMLLPKLKFKKILDRLNFFKHNSKTKKTREGYYMLNRYVRYVLKGLNFNIHLHK